MQVMFGIVGTLAVIALAVIGTAVGVVLFLRRNPKIQAQANAAVDQVAKK